jgi:hypothetical protein
MAAALVLSGITAQAASASMEYFTCGRPGEISFRFIPATKTITHTTGTVGGHPLTGAIVDVTSFTNLNCRDCVEASGEFFANRDVVNMQVRTRYEGSKLVADFIFRTSPAAPPKHDTVPCY